FAQALAAPPGAQPHPRQRLFGAGLDLFVHRAIGGPSAGHGNPPCEERIHCPTGRNGCDCGHWQEALPPPRHRVSGPAGRAGWIIPDICGTFSPWGRLTLHLRINSLSETKGRRMSDKTLTRMDLAEAVFREVGLSRHESAQLVESVLGHISDALVRGEQVKISSFGTFSGRDKNGRIGRNPTTGEEVPITPRRVLSFRPSHLMKERIAAGNRR